MSDIHGKEQGEMEKAQKMAIHLYASGISEKLIAKIANVDINLVRKWIGLPPA